MEESYKFPRKVIMEKAGISYVEEGPNVVYKNVIADDNNIKLLATIDQSDLGNAFSAMTFGKLLETIHQLEALEEAKALEDQVLDEVE